MKNALLATCLFLNLSVVAQDCKDYYFLQNNKTIEMTSYSKKGKPNGKQVHQVSNVVTNGGAIAGDVKTELYDDKGQLLSTTYNHIQCQGGIMMLDMQMMFPQQQQQATTSANVKLEHYYLEYPAEMHEGDVLKDAAMEMDMDMNGMKQQVNMVINNRKVEGKETITTPAGMWDCFKISYKGIMTIKTIGIGIPISLTGTAWFAPGFGIVKSQSASGSTELTAIN